MSQDLTRIISLTNVIAGTGLKRSKKDDDGGIVLRCKLGLLLMPFHYPGLAPRNYPPGFPSNF